jgi:hypothetical protein
LEKVANASLNLYDLMAFEEGLFGTVSFQSIKKHVRNAINRLILPAFKLLNCLDTPKTLKKLGFCQTDNPWTWVVEGRKKVFLATSLSQGTRLCNTPKVCGCLLHSFTLPLYLRLVRYWCANVTVKDAGL